jgi:hypothetical protein
MNQCSKYLYCRSDTYEIVADIRDPEVMSLKPSIDGTLSLTHGPQVVLDIKELREDGDDNKCVVCLDREADAVRSCPLPSPFFAPLVIDQLSEADPARVRARGHLLRVRGAHLGAARGPGAAVPAVPAGLLRRHAHHLPRRRSGSLHHLTQPTTSPPWHGSHTPGDSPVTHPPLSTAWLTHAGGLSRYPSTTLHQRRYPPHAPHTLCILMRSAHSASCYLSPCLFMSCSTLLSTGVATPGAPPSATRS